MFYAVTEDGVELPVIDVTHPTFAVEDKEERLREAWQRDSRERKDWEHKPRWVRRLMFWAARRNSVLLGSLSARQGTFLDAMSTYLMKLGPQHIGAGYAKRLDRQIAGSPAVLDIRLRLQRVAHVVADALESAAVARPGRDIHFIDIAGGPAIDAINALLLLRQRPATQLDGRFIRLHVLDAHREAPAFGARALAALQADGGPLRGLDCRFEYRPYDWNAAAGLGDTLAAIGPDAVVAGTSEGGLFQYGSDDAIVANLAALRDTTPSDFTFTGTISPNTPENLRDRRMMQITVRHFDTSAFETLVARAGWRPDRILPARRNTVVRLVKA
ncbi:MAG TPA: hypothetical protein VHE61_09130 [Opitutaceae bacterium]|nr:hypothetical protein [Opitutaceae bacterium]